MEITIFTRNPNHEKYGNCLEGITENHERHLNQRMTGVFRTDESLDMYVLTHAGDYPTWEHPEAGDVALWNTHPTGELRWAVRISDGCSTMESNDLLAVKHFGLKLKGVTDERWKEILDAHIVNLEDLSEVEVKVLKMVNTRSGSHSIIREEKVQLLDDEEEKWHHTIRNPPEAGAIYSLQGKGLVETTGSVSGPTGQAQHIWRSSDMYRITARGRMILDKGKA